VPRVRRPRRRAALDVEIMVTPGFWGV